MVKLSSLNPFSGRSATGTQIKSGVSSPTSRAIAEGSSAAVSERNDINFGATREASSKGMSRLSKCLVAGMAALTLATALAPPVQAQAICSLSDGCQVEQTVPADHAHRDGVGQFTIFRNSAGEVEVNLGTNNDMSFSPNGDIITQIPNSDHGTLMNQVGETLCEQAQDLNDGWNGSICHDHNDVTIGSPSGPIRMSMSEDGQEMSVLSTDGNLIYMEQTADGAKLSAESGWKVNVQDSGRAYYY